MKRTMTMTVQSIMLVAVLFSSCTKNLTGSDLSSLNTNVIKPTYLPGPCPYDCHDTRCKAYANGYCGTTIDSIAVIKNSANPYDNVGKQHNDGIRSILATLPSPYTDSATLAKDKVYVTSLGYRADSLQSFYNLGVSLHYFPFSKIPELDSLGNSLYASGRLSSYANSYVQSVYAKAYMYLNSDTGSKTNYIAFANSVISIETSVSSDTHLSAYEKQVLLSSFAVSRYSASYWGNVLAGSGGGGAQAIHPLLFQKLKRWLRIAISDVGGGIIGIVGGPVGIIGGAVGGSIMADASID